MFKFLNIMLAVMLGSIAGSAGRQAEPYPHNSIGEVISEKDLIQQMPATANENVTQLFVNVLDDKSEVHYFVLAEDDETTDEEAESETSPQRSRRDVQKKGHNILPGRKTVTHDDEMPKNLPHVPGTSSAAQAHQSAKNLPHVPATSSSAQAHQSKKNLPHVPATSSAAPAPESGDDVYDPDYDAYYDDEPSYLDLPPTSSTKRTPSIRQDPRALGMAMHDNARAKNLPHVPGTSSAAQAH